MKKTKIVGVLLGLLGSLPIFLYLLYWILSQLNPDRLVWFLYWTYVPIAIIVSILIKVSEDE